MLEDQQQEEWGYLISQLIIKKSNNRFNSSSSSSTLCSNNSKYLTSSIFHNKLSLSNSNIAEQQARTSTSTDKMIVFTIYWFRRMRVKNSQFQ